MAKNLQITVNGKTYSVQVGDVSGSPVEVVVDGQKKVVSWAEATAAPAPVAVAAAPAAAPAAPAEAAPAPAPVATAPGEGSVVKAPMPGKVLAVRVAVGDTVAEGQTVATIEAMKMEMPIAATVSGKITGVMISVGDNVAFDDALITIG